MPPGVGFPAAASGWTVFGNEPDYVGFVIEQPAGF